MKTHILLLIIITFATACNSQVQDETKHKGVIFKDWVLDLNDLKILSENDEKQLNIVWNINDEKAENNVIKPHTNIIIKDNDEKEFLIKFTETDIREINQSYTVLLRNVNTKEEIWTYSNSSFCYFGHTIQLIVAGNKIIIAAHSPIASGSDLICLDIYSGKEIWRGDIKQLYVGHSQYSNSVYLKLFGDKIVMAGDEAGGNYIQIIDLNTGANLFAKIDCPALNKREILRNSSELIFNIDIYFDYFQDGYNKSYNCKITEIIKGHITDTLIHLVLDIENFNKWEKLLPQNNFAVPLRLELGFISVEKNDTCINGFIDKNKNNLEIKYLQSHTYY